MSNCEVCLPRRARGAGCKYVQAQAQRADKALSELKASMEALAKAKLEAMQRERDEYRKIIASLLSEAKGVVASGVAADGRDRLEKKLEERRKANGAATPAQKAMPL